MLAYFSYYIVAGTDLCQAIGQFAVCEFIALNVTSFLPCAYDGLCSRWVVDARNRRRGARGVLFLLISRVLRLVDHEDITELFDDSSFGLRHVLHAFRRTQEVDWSESCVGSFLYSFPEGAAERAEAFTMLGQKEVLRENCYRRKRFRKLSLPGCQKTISLS